MSALRVAIADDSALMREGVGRVLSDAGFDVVSQTENAVDLMHAIGSLKPDVAVVDIRMPPTHTDEGVAKVIACEQALSRFDPTSDISRLNASAGAWTPVGGRLLEALQAGLQAREETNGRFDPTILPALVAAGYDRSFKPLAERPPRPTSGWLPGGSIEVNVSAASAHVEALLVNLGGIDKATRRLARSPLCEQHSPTSKVRLSISAGTSRSGARLPAAGCGASRSPTRDAIRFRVLEPASSQVATSGPDATAFGEKAAPPRRPTAHRQKVAHWRRVARGGRHVSKAHATALAVTPLADSAEYLLSDPVRPVLTGNAAAARCGAVRFAV